MYVGRSTSIRYEQRHDISLPIHPGKCPAALSAPQCSPDSLLLHPHPCQNRLHPGRRPSPTSQTRPDQTRPTCRHQADEAECMRLPTRQSGSMDPPRARSRDSLLRIASPNVAKPQLCSHPGRYPPQEERKGSSVTCNASRFFERGKTETRQLARPLSRRLNSRVKLPPPPPPPPSVSVDRFARGR